MGTMFAQHLWTIQETTKKIQGLRSSASCWAQGNAGIDDIFWLKSCCSPLHDTFSTSPDPKTDVSWHEGRRTSDVTAAL
jgi:hypothetical protein